MSEPNPGRELARKRWEGVSKEERTRLMRAAALTRWGQRNPAHRVKAITVRKAVKAKQRRDEGNQALEG